MRLALPTFTTVHVGNVILTQRSTLKISHMNKIYYIPHYPQRRRLLVYTLLFYLYNIFMCMFSQSVVQVLRINILPNLWMSTGIMNPSTKIYAYNKWILLQSIKSLGEYEIFVRLFSDIVIIVSSLKAK